MFEVNNRNTRARCEVYLILTIKTPERRHWRVSGVFIVKFEYIFSPSSSVYNVNFEQVNAGWAVSYFKFGMFIWRKTKVRIHAELLQKPVLNYFAKFIGKHLQWSLVSCKVEGLGCNFTKNRTQL